MSLYDFHRLQDKLGSVNDPVGFLVNLFAYAPVGFAVWTADGHGLLTNQAFMDIFGVEPPPEYNVLQDELLAKSGLLQYFQRGFKGETVHVPTFWYDPRDLTSIKVESGRRVAISMTIFPLFKSSGEIEYVAATYKDETEVTKLNANLEQLVQERTIQLNAVNRELESFSYSVAHDLRSPLRNMHGFASVLSQEYRDVLDEEGLELLLKIQSSSVTMGHLIDALLGLAQVTRDKLQLALVDLSALARQTTAQLISAESMRVVDIVVQENLQARMDPALAGALLENLIANAWKFTSQSSAARVEIGSQTIDGQQVFFVRDNGAGFNQVEATQLFKPFHRLHSVDEFPGTGVGLATARRIVDRHGGRIWGEGSIGKGATFFFTLPSSI